MQPVAKSFWVSAPVPGSRSKITNASDPFETA
jgi:hypothetical protein